MTELELKELSKVVAAKYGIDELVHGGYDRFGDELDAIWLHADSGRCFDLSLKARINIDFDDKVVRTFNDTFFFAEAYNGNEEQAARVAVLRALLAKGE